MKMERAKRLEIFEVALQIIADEIAYLSSEADDASDDAPGGSGGCL